ncbi:MAG: response regulator transcription factor [Ruminiclostridium sp.]|nr:response regulator transcription factor [Ruminiclostridium sp.]
MRFAVCDDEAELRRDISDRIEALCPDAEVAAFSSGRELLASSDSFDIIILDIGMDGLDGMQTALELRKNGCRAVIIFVTAFEDRVFDAFDVGAFHFLVKPVSPEKFAEVLKKAAESRSGQPSPKPDERYIAIKTGGLNTKIALSEIMYAEVFDRRVILHTTGGKIGYYGKLSELERVAGDGFFRSHRSYLVNLRWLEKYTSSEITMENGDRVLLAKQRYSALIKAYMRYIKSEG